MVSAALRVREALMRGSIEVLRYRNVFRVGIAYVVAGWLIAQVADEKPRKRLKQNNLCLY